ncbi:MAG: hypothetical protein L7F77_08040 [Candidatus Magnetominusculus sp. LBB02]|nr:hypothetical protein [Candidatus Magnetominusculus sp. LBB02]
MKLKGKKIAIFNALPHHGRFLFPIAGEARRQGAEILFFTTLVDYPYEGDVIRNGFKCKFLIEYADKDTNAKIKDATNKLLQQWSAVNFSWHGFRHWSLFQQHRSLIRNVEDYFCLDALIRQEKPDMFLTLHEMNPWGKQIGHLSKKYDIAYITLQEGDYYNPMLNFSTHSEYSMVNLIWGVQTRDTLLCHKCAFHKLILIGNTHIDDAVKKLTLPSMVKSIKKELSIPADKKVVAFMPNTHWGAVVERTAWVELLRDLKRPDIVCVFKWHPQVVYTAYLDIKKIIEELLPGAVVVFSYDPYKILAVADYCVVMGKTTLGVEALAFGKPLFDLFNIINGEEYYKDIGVAQSVSPSGNWEALFQTMQKGIPDEIKEAADKFVDRVFYRLDGKSIERALDVISFMLQTKDAGVAGRQAEVRIEFKNAAINDRISIVIPSGRDTLSLMTTLNSISWNCRHKDTEIIVVANDDGVKEDVSRGVNGIEIIDCKSDNMALLYNRGAELATGQYIIFMLPGVFYYKDDGLMEAASGGIAGTELRNPDLTPYNLGIGVDFNTAPCPVLSHDKPPKYVSSAFCMFTRQVLEAIGGFDENIEYFTVDACLTAEAKGFKPAFAKEGMMMVFKYPNFMPSPDLRYHTGQWKRSAGFFARWYNKLEKDDDYLDYAKDMLK